MSTRNADLTRAFRPVQLGATSKHVKTLELFAYGTLEDYKGSPGSYLDLKPPQLRKLELITIAEKASQKSVLPYSELMAVLGRQEVRQLEDKIIDCMYNGLLKGKLNQKN